MPVRQIGRRSCWGQQTSKTRMPIKKLKKKINTPASKGNGGQPSSGNKVNKVVQFKEESEDTQHSHASNKTAHKNTPTSKPPKINTTKSTPSSDNSEKATNPKKREHSSNEDAPKLKKVKVEKIEEGDSEIERKRPTLVVQHKKPSVAEIEELLVDKTQQTPQTVVDYERVLVGSPNSSYVWIRYMAYYALLAETDKARAVAERALKRIQTSDTKEKYNICTKLAPGTAYLNLEILYGTKDTIMNIFQRSLAYNDPKKMYMHLGFLLGQGNMHELAQEVLQTALRKYHASKKVLQAYLDYLLLSKHDLTSFRSQLTQRIKNLPKKKHTQVIKHCAVQEYKHGEVERARTMFEGLVASNPKHADLWMVYIDMEMKAHGDDKVAMRRLFERCISLQLSPKSMKTVFKKYMTYEQQNGDTKAMEHVRTKAIEYVNKAK